MSGYHRLFLYNGDNIIDINNYVCTSFPTNRLNDRVMGNCHVFISIKRPAVFRFRQQVGLCHSTQNKHTNEHSLYRLQHGRGLTYFIIKQSDSLVCT